MSLLKNIEGYMKFTDEEIAFIRNAIVITKNEMLSSEKKTENQKKLERKKSFEKTLEKFEDVILDYED